MNYTRNIISTFQKRLMLACVVFVLILSYFAGSAQAADLVNRSIRLSSSFPSEVVTHRFTLTSVTSSNIGSIQFQYCSNSPLFIDPCVAPAGLNVATAGIFSQAGLTGFSVSGASNANSLIITKAPVAEVPVASTFVFNNITNPSTSNQIVFVRISTFDNINATGATVDTGAVVFVVDDRFDVSAYVPPYLTFCVGVTVNLYCASATGFLADFGEFRTNSTSVTTTQMAAATNDPNGYNIFVNGQTMTSGSNVISRLTTQTPSQPGVSQFGINLRSNSNPSLGANPDAGPVASGTPDSNYNTPNQFRFASGDRVAGANGSTGFNRYTVSYIVNVPTDQKPGVYAATLIYTSIASF